MQPLSTTSQGPTVASTAADYTDANASGVSWGAIFAGAVAAAALSFILIILGFGLGLSAVSPWSNNGASATTIGVSTILWIAFTQIVASGLGGYLAGRLRVKWSNLHGDEVYFRDTAHGLFAWAVASLATAAFLTSAVGSILSGGIQARSATVHAAASVATSAASTAATATNAPQSSGGPIGYFVDTLFRAPQAESDATGTASHQEALNIFATNLRSGQLNPEDSQYLAQIVAKRTGLSQADAEKRVNKTYARFSKTIADAEATAKTAADKARKAAAYSALWMFVALLCGAFVASLCATFGGRQRDRTDFQYSARDGI